MDDIVIYGNGVWGNKIYDYFEQLGVKITYFIKTAPDSKTFKNIPVLSPEELFITNKEAVIIIAIKDERTVKQICTQLFSIGFNEGQIWGLNSTIRELVTSKERFNSIQKNNAGEKFCNCCQKKVLNFMPSYGVNSEIFKKHRIIGGGYREDSICPLCGANDRIRWQKYVLENFTDIMKKQCSVLHIAPETPIQKLLNFNTKCDYYAGDIDLDKAEHKIDLTDIQFRDSFFDYVIANHVLEHIERIDIAFSEIKRVLKPDGKLIVSFPICMDIKTKEDKSITQPEDRLKEYGQVDHVRLFGCDYKEQIEKLGLRADVKSPRDILADDIIKKYGMIKDDVILICHKNIQ